VRLNVNLPESLYFIADSNEMDSIFNNLLSNAVKYNKPDGGMVNLDLRKEGDKIIITVEDTGIGMSEEDVSNFSTICQNKIGKDQRHQWERLRFIHRQKNC
jgi:signal transduction histidine kinase